ncbi:protein kinase domain-containing protein [Arthroderma uncinatum]|uniref:protein kinase domain-containing protein n=1 Tax=Arthroderma uncinatum TaxID=74035 RepID=UPI00144AC1D4|nr:protein kinase domain-containing protein [Arthroderma uncinatum]KAF3483914.1 protein kinase domain-containing protein [Arthroderma uncinatum]
MTSFSIEFVPRSYEEEELYRGAKGFGVPYCSVRAIARSGHKKWHIKISFRHRIPSQIMKKKLERRLEFEAFISHIDFHSLPPLIDDTVTEVELTSITQPIPPDFQSGPLPLKQKLTPSLTLRNRFDEVSNKLRYTIREDVSRVIYPQVEDLSVPTRWLSDIKLKEGLPSAVPWISLAKLDENGRWYIYKEIERPFYSPRDSDVMQQELRNLMQFRHVPNIVQLVAVVVSRNPYLTTTPVNDKPVMRGILLEYYSGGTLELILKESDGKNLPWRRWALQIADGLNQLHLRGITHMDLKPSNIMIDNEGNAVLIDISGIGGVTHEWLAPELQDILDPLSLPFGTRQRNGIWAYGKHIQEMAALSGNIEERELLEGVAYASAIDNPALRLNLPYIITSLKRQYTELFSKPLASNN